MEPFLLACGPLCINCWSSILADGAEEEKMEADTDGPQAEKVKV